MLKRILFVLTLTILAAACDQLGPTSPTPNPKPDPPVPVVQTPTPDPGAPSNPTPSPSPTPSPAPVAQWHATLYQGVWYSDFRLPTEFIVSWDATHVFFGQLTATVELTTSNGITASFGVYPNKGSLILNFSDTSHATWSLNSLDGQASGIMELK